MAPFGPMRFAWMARTRQLQTMSVRPKLDVSNKTTVFRQAKPKPEDEIVVAMSGGVDSSLTAALYASEYANVRGIYMANWSQTAKCTEADWNDVQKVCLKVGIPCERVNFEKDYWNDVFEPMIEMYQQGLTPNPDLGCNRHIKFGKMLDHLSSTPTKNGVKRWLATGHYARIVQEDDPGVEFSLARGFESSKDQSYYLASIPSEVLANVLMPLGHYTKKHVRELARDQFGLHTAAKPDSVGLCFVSPSHTKFRDFLNEYIPPNPGNIVTADGKVWGTHQGLWHATVGQKAGITMPQGDPAYKGVWFVSEKRAATNELVIVRGTQNPALFKRHLRVLEWRWFGHRPLELSLDAVTLRYQSLGTPVPVQTVDEGSAGTVSIVLEKPQRAMAPGQNVVLYNGERVLASGTIESAN